MTQDSPRSEGPAAPTPAFVWMAVGMLAMLLLCGVVTAALMASQAEQINRDGGMAWLLFGGIYVAVATLVSSACALCAIMSLWRREAHRTLSIVLLVGSCLFLWAFGGPTLRFIQGAFGQNEGASYMPVQSRQPASRAVTSATIPDSLLRHFQERGIVLTPARDGDRNTEWINEHTDLAMFHPHARGTTSGVQDCEQWPGKSTGIIERFLDAFTSYQPATIGVRLNPVK